MKVRVLILLMCCCAAPIFAHAQSGASLRIVTYNIHHAEGTDGKLDLDRIASVLREADADVICLQEIDRNLPRTNQLDFPQELAKRLEMPAVFECNFAFDGGEYGNATFTRLEVISHENIALPNPNKAEPRGCLKTIVRTVAGPIQILNTHLGLKGDERLAQANAICKMLEDMPTILAGDMNEGITDPGLSLFTQKLTDLATKGGVSPDPIPPSTHARIDHIFASTTFSALSARVIDSPNAQVASDHRPILVQASLPVAAAPGPAVIEPDLPFEMPEGSELDAYGGWKGLKGQATGFFHTEQLGGRWWFITPEGNAYFMLHMGWTDARDKARVQSWGFNASEPESGMPYALHMNFFRQEPVKQLPVVARLGYPPWVTFPDVFDPEWPRLCEQHAQNVLGPRANDPLMIGYFLDNEVCFEGWYEAVMNAPKDAPCRAAFVEVARAYYAGKPGALEKDWAEYKVTKIEDLLDVNGAPPNLPDLESAWVAAVADRAFSVACGAGKAAAPHHINLGPRLINAPLPHPGVLAAMTKYCDVLSLNLYNLYADKLMTQLFTLVPAFNQFTGKPTLTSEFSFRGGDTIHPNTMGALPSVKTQAERAVGYLSYVSALASIPSHIGVSWYKYPDDSPYARWEGYAEDCNFGVIDPARRPYAVLTQAMRATNACIYELAADPQKNPENPLFWRTELKRWDVPGDQTLLQLFAHSSEPYVDPMTQMLPEPRRYHPAYWVSHHSPHLTVNDDRILGWAQANLIEQKDDGSTLLTLLNLQAIAWLPRNLWLGRDCENPDGRMALESNAQFLARHVEANGAVRRITLADGSYLRSEQMAMELRTNVRTPYLDLRFDHAAKKLVITSRGAMRQLGLLGVDGWSVIWNDAPVDPARIGQTEGMTTITTPF